MAEEYLLVIDGKPQGPYSLPQLKGMSIRPGDFVKSAGMIDYKEAHEIPELRDLLGFKHQAAAPQYFGGFDQRLMAWALDWFFMLIAAALLAFASFIFITGDDERRLAIFAIPALGQVLNFIYHVMMECSVAQATFGKQIVKIRVADLHGLRISFGRSLGRNLAKIFSSAIFGIGYLFSFFNPKQQCLHDMMAGTLVVKDRLF